MKIITWGETYMINPNPEDYGKPFHYLLSPSTFLDLDSFVYIVVLALLVFGIVRLVAKCKGRKGISFIDFFAKYMFACSIPVFLLFFVQLAMSGQWVVTNIIITCLPLVYGLIIQLIFMLIKKLKH